MDVACSTLCFGDLPIEEALRRIAEMEFSKVDLAVGDVPGCDLSPRLVSENLAHVLKRIRQGPTVGFAGVTLRLQAAEAATPELVDSIAHLAKQLAAPLVTVDPSPAGTTLADESTRLAGLVRAAGVHGVNVAVATKMDSTTELPDDGVELCTKTAGLFLTLDPTHYLCGANQGKAYDQVVPHVRNVHLRDSGRGKDQFQVRVGRGEIEYGRLVTTLGRFGYKGSLTVAIDPSIAGDFDPVAEVRKLRLVLESLL
ncbi:MAG: sugar phosphate isomerase/epimerase family protein [Planctomycetia bacterium]